MLTNAQPQGTDLQQFIGQGFLNRQPDRERLGARFLFDTC